MLSHSTPKTILIAEDDPATRVFLADNLAADGYRVRVADTTAKALAVLQVDPPDLMVVDVNGRAPPTRWTGGRRATGAQIAPGCCATTTACPSRWWRGWSRC